jgi:hypothetical protein
MLKSITTECRGDKKNNGVKEYFSTQSKLQARKPIVAKPGKVSAPQ